MTQPKLLARKVARELTPGELQLVAGGTTSGSPPSTGGSYTGTGCGYTGFWNTYSCSDISGGGSELPGPRIEDSPPPP